MAQSIYSPRTLNDNWFEDRQHAPEALSATSNLHKKTPRSFETDLAHVGEKYDVLTRVSRMPPRVSYALPMDGITQKLRTSTVDFADPKSRPEFSARGRVAAPSVINTANAPVCPPEQRPVPGPRSGFGAALQRHDEDPGRRFYNTTHCDFYGEGSHRHTPRCDPCYEDQAGLHSAREEQKVSGRKLGKLCGEHLQESQDPAANSRTQRSWLYREDPGLRHLEQGGTRQPPLSTDTALSLPMGEGGIGKVRADAIERKGQLYRVAANITRGRGPSNEKSGVRVFTDD
mmetsp:Transcript_53018/g.119439  ORF Transcript_53018/g.119439 Transcript_53018/m.119439 type:complete len:287 (+) Transcript_53018:73-933(+)